jgi:hypothetical protein
MFLLPKSLPKHDFVHIPLAPVASHQMLPGIHHTISINHKTVFIVVVMLRNKTSAVTEMSTRLQIKVQAFGVIKAPIFVAKVTREQSLFCYKQDILAQQK